MEFVEALQEFLFHQGFQKIKYDSKILWGKDTGDKLSLLEVVPPLLPGQPRIGLKQREEEMLDIERQIMLKYRKKVEHLLLILNKEKQILKKEKKRKNIQIYGFLI
jgi:rhomboid protease GluP